MRGLLEKLAAVCRETRRESGRTQIEIATAVGVGHVTVSRFERAVRWPREIEALVEAYADASGVTARELWLRAIES